MRPDPGDFAALVEASPYCVLLHDPVTKDILWANRATQELLGFTLEELLPLKAPDMSSTDESYSRLLGHRWLQRAVDHGVADTEWAYRNKNGTVILSEATAKLVQLAGRQVIMVQFRDIGREERTRQSLSRTEAFVATLLAHLDEGILILDESAVVSVASPAAARLLGSSVDALQATTVDAVSAPATIADTRTTIERARRLGRAQGFRFAHDVPGEGTRWFGASVQHTNIPDGFAGFLLLFHDVTDRVRHDQELEREKQHLHYLARFTAMGDMATTIEHEIAQPTTAAMNFIAGTQALLDAGPVDDAALRTGLTSARAQLARTAVIMKSLRDYVTELEQSLQLVDLNTIVDDCRELIRLRAEQHDVRVRYELAEEPLPVSCELVLTGQVMLNLCFNAIEEMAVCPSDERSVLVETMRSGDRAAFRVTDRGRGLGHIPDGRIFDGAFTSKRDGHGIGLALSHQVIHRQDGTISATENRPNGAIFEFALPLQPDADTETETASS